MLDEAAWWDDLVTGLRPMSYGAKGVPARCLVSVSPTTAAKASSEGWRLRLRPNSRQMGNTVRVVPTKFSSQQTSVKLNSIPFGKQKLNQSVVSLLGLCCTTKS
jgi:hypothetical protein